MAKSLDGINRTGDDRIPVDGTLQYRWAKNMHDIKPHTGQNIVTGGAGRFDHPKSENNKPFYMTGGTKRSHVEE